jgi:hypothetical protein
MKAIIPMSIKHTKKTNNPSSPNVFIATLNITQKRFGVQSVTESNRT